MEPTTVGVIGLIALFALLLIRMPVGLAMMAVGFVGIGVLNNWNAAMSVMASESFVNASNYNLMVIPLFVLMGNLASLSGMSSDLYKLAYAWVGHWRGGLASATVVGCAGFAALSGSSLASAITMGQVALPEMRRYKYDDKLATGSIAAGGTLGILIPPSTGFVIYAILTEQSIGRLFIAGILPGILLTTLFVVAIGIVTRIQPGAAPAGPGTSSSEKFKAFIQAIPILLIALLTIGGIYGGVFTPVEAAGVGAFLALVVAILRRSLNVKSLSDVVLQSMRTTAMAFLILIGAHVLTPFFALTHIPDALANFLLSFNLGPTAILLFILLTYIILGTFMEGLAMLVLTLPIVFPLIVTLGFNPIWFGVVAVIVLEMGLISPPVGMNVYMVKSIAEDVPMGDIFKGIFPFWLAMLVCLILLVLFPQIALVLPNMMK